MNRSKFTPYVVIMEDPIIHTDLHPFCSDLTCSCHDDPEEMDKLLKRMKAGEITGGQALNIYWNQVS